MKKQLKISVTESLSQRLKNKLNFLLGLSVKIVSIILLIICLRWAGLKGIISFLFGMAIMAYLMLSNNSLMMFFIKMFSDKQYLEEIMGEKEIYHDEKE